jgi:hypothetical protein
MAQAVTELSGASSPVDVDKIVAYIERCRTADGGYFFARVPPASARDTYHAVEALHLLDRRPAEKQALVTWIRQAIGSGLAGQPYGLFYLTKAAVRLGLEPHHLRERAEAVAVPLLDGRRPPARLYVEVPSELEATCMALESCLELGLEVDRDRVADLVLEFRNADGGFGSNGRSTLPSTYFAAVTLARVGAEGWPVEDTVAWLKRCESEWRLQFLEHLFWLSGALRPLGSRIERCEEAAGFVLACQKPSGGFGRAPVGIATLEDTHRAVAILAEVGALP